MSKKKMSYEEVIESWIEAYKFCISYEANIALGTKVLQEDLDDYLNNKAALITSTVEIFATQSMEIKGEYNKEYILELYEGLKTELDKEGISLMEFDEKYIAEMIDKFEDALKEALEEDTNKMNNDTEEKKNKN